MKYNKLKYKVLTDNGWSDFEGIKRNESQPTVTFYFDDNKLTCTIDHRIYYSPTSCKEAKFFKVGEYVCSDNGYQKIISIKNNLDSELVYDIIGVDKNNRFYANNILVHNCQFIGQTNTLIESNMMRELLAKTKLITYQYVVCGDIRFYKQLQPNMKYLIAVDPSMGVSGDFSAIQIFEFPTFEQVGEWMSDSINQNEQVEKLKSLTEWMYSDLKVKGCRYPEIYWSVENNSVGEGFICSMREKATASGFGMTEEYITRATVITQYGNKRLGFTTDKRNKTMSCAQLKNLIENRIMKVNSADYVSQLSNFTIDSVSYSSKGSNEHDDLVTASLTIILMYLQMKDSLELDKEIQSYSSPIRQRDDFDLPFIYVLN